MSLYIDSYDNKHRTQEDINEVLNKYNINFGSVDAENFKPEYFFETLGIMTALFHKVELEARIWQHERVEAPIRLFEELSIIKDKVTEYSFYMADVVEYKKNVPDLPEFEYAENPETPDNPEL